jgi:hypothetical protein
MNSIPRINLSLCLLAFGLSWMQACKIEINPITEKETRTTLKVKDSTHQHVGYVKVNTARITDIDKFQFELTPEESKRYLPERFFDIAIVFESAKILPAKSPKLRGETNPDAGDYVLAYKEWESSRAFSPSAASIKRADLYTSDGKQMDDPAQRHNDPGRYSLTMNEELRLDILALKKSGRIVLMDIMPDHEDAGWRSFNTEVQAKKFAAQINEAINKYGWDGIDIDEEYAKYSNGPYAGSITRVLYELKKIWEREDSRHPGKKLILAKALWSDAGDFNASVNVDGKDVRLADLLTYGWDMSYDRPSSYRLSPYLTRFGMQKYQLGLGIDFVKVNSKESGVAIAQYVKDNNLKFVMYYDVKVGDSSKYQAVSNVFQARKLHVAL